MPQDDVQNRVRRRRRGSAASSSSYSNTDPEGLPEDLNEQVALRAQPSTIEPLTDVESSQGSREDAPADFTPHNRLKQVNSRASDYAREYRLKLLGRMLMRNVPLDEIAKELGVSVSTVQRDRRELYTRLRDAARHIDLNEFIGRGTSFYEEVRGMALRAASSTKAPLNIRLAAMRTGLAANNDMTKFLAQVGVFDVLQYATAERQGSNDMEKLVALTEAFLNDDETSEAAQEVLSGDVDDLDIHLL